MLRGKYDLVNENKKKKIKCENENLIVVCMIYGNISTVPVCAVLPWLPPALESQTFDFTILIMVMMMRIINQFHAQKDLFKVPKICNIDFWIENDPPPFGIFPKTHLIW